jgi:hypothetical protein
VTASTRAGRAVQLQRIGGSKLGLSDDPVTFIGGVKFETRKQFSPRTSLSLLSEYDWYSWVPAMRYNDGDEV